METFHSDGALGCVVPQPTAEEAAAIVAALSLFQSEESAETAAVISRWTNAGRLESLGLRREGRDFRPGWRT